MVDDVSEWIEDEISEVFGRNMALISSNQPHAGICVPVSAGFRQGQDPHWVLWTPGAELGSE